MDNDVDVKGFRTVRYLFLSFARDRSAKSRKSSNSERRCSVEFIERSCPCGGAAISKVVRSRRGAKMAAAAAAQVGVEK